MCIRDRSSIRLSHAVDVHDGCRSRQVVPMIVRQFLQWIRHAPPGERAEATSALARAYLYSDLSPDDIAAAEGAMIMLLDDPSPLVRRALADVFATAQPAAQAAIASRAMLPRSLAAAIAEVGSAQACLALLENSGADIASFSIDRVVERFGHLAAIREPVLARADLPMATRQALLSKLSQTLAGFVAGRQWLGPEHAEDAAREACEKATVALAADTPYEEVSHLVQHLRQSGQLTAGMILRALLSGNVVLFEEALAELSGVPIDRVTSYIHDRNISGLSALYRKAGLPDTAYPAFRAAIAAMREGALVGERGGAARLKRRMVERVLSACAAERGRDLTSLLALLRRFVVEAAREEARMFCDDLVANDHSIDAGRLIDDARLVA